MGVARKEYGRKGADLLLNMWHSNLSDFDTPKYAAFTETRPGLHGKVGMQCAVRPKMEGPNSQPLMEDLPQSYGKMSLPKCSPIR